MSSPLIPTRLAHFIEYVGPSYGTVELSKFLSAIVEMQLPEVVVELGTGLGASAIWMAHALKRNGIGHLWTVDDGESFERRPQIFADIVSYLRDNNIATFAPCGSQEYFTEIARAFEVQDYVTFIKSKLRVHERGHFDSYPFNDKRIDLLFSDFAHGPSTVLSLLAHFLPRMSAASSMFIDSASTSWPTYLLLENVVSNLNHGIVPYELQARSDANLNGVMQNRRINLIHLTKKKGRNQNSTAWLKIEPVDVFPHPRVAMHNLKD